MGADKRAYNAAYYARHRVEQAAKQKEWFHALSPEKREKLLRYKRDYYQTHKRAWRYHRMVQKYGITLDEYENLWASQEGCCAVCQTPEGSGRYELLYVDHNHRTGEVRGLLCHGCNLGLGHLKDDPALLRKAAEYLDLKGGGF